MNYGLPYKGSKRKLAERIVAALPKKKHFYDLFCGGCSVTHRALKTYKFEHIHINDINWMCPTLFKDAISGRFKNENRWISRKEFYELKDKEPYVAFCWSFGNNLHGYLYSEEIEPWKKALHYARLYDDYSLFAQMGINSDGSRKDILEHEQEYKNLYIQWYVSTIKRYDERHMRYYFSDKGRKLKMDKEFLLQYLRDALDKSGLKGPDVDKKLGTATMADRHFFRHSQFQFPTHEMYEDMQTFMPLPIPYEDVYDLSGITSKQELLRLESSSATRLLINEMSVPNYDCLTSSVGDYQNVRIEDDSVVYCDIPYANTDGYNKGCKMSFDYDRFYKWAEEISARNIPVFISEYDMPRDRFIPIREWDHRSLLARNNNKAVTERLFIPISQRRTDEVQLLLF